MVEEREAEDVFPSISLSSRAFPVTGEESLVVSRICECIVCMYLRGTYDVCTVYMYVRRCLLLLLLLL